MRTFLLIIYIVCIGQAYNLDSLVSQSQINKQKSREFPGFVLNKTLSRQMPLIPIENVKEALRDTALHGLIPHPAITNNFASLNEYTEVRSKIKLLEESINKTTVILTNIQEQNESTRKNLDLLVKIFEAFTALIGAITALIVTLKKIKLI